MKNQHLLFLAILPLLTSCQLEEPLSPGEFSSLQDTLVLSTMKHRGPGLFMIGAGSFRFRDTTHEFAKEWLTYPIQYPDGMDSLKVGFRVIAFDPFRFWGEPEPEPDTSGLSKDKSNTILALSGIRGGEEIYIFDQNHNQDFRDDAVRTMGTMDWKPTEDLIPCYYTIEKGNGEMLQDTSWFRIGEFNGRLLSQSNQHVTSTFSIDDYEYQIGVYDYNSSSFDWVRPQISVLSEGKLKRDTLLLRDYLDLGEHLKLGEYYYKFADFYSGDGTVVLVRDPDFDKKEAVQIDALAPDFEFVSLNGDTLNKDGVKEDFLLITNFSGCTPRSYDVYQDILDADLKNFFVVGLESGLSVDLGGVTLDVENPFNEDMYEKYRSWYSSYDSYLIDKDGRIVDKFAIFDWEDHLKDFLDPEVFKN